MANNHIEFPDQWKLTTYNSQDGSSRLLCEMSKPHFHNALRARDKKYLAEFASEMVGLLPKSAYRDQQHIHLNLTAWEKQNLFMLAEYFRRLAGQLHSEQNRELEVLNEKEANLKAELAKIEREKEMLKKSQSISRS